MGSRIGSSGPLTPSTPPPDCEKAAQLITSNFDKMQAYSKVIIGLGYGALLAIWSGTQRSLTQRSRIASGLLILISILAYILFEIGQMLWFSWMHWKWAASTQKKSLQVAIAEAQKREDRYRAVHLLAWIIAFVISVASGLSAAGILIYAFCSGLFK